MQFVEENYKLSSKRNNWKWKILHTVLKRPTLSFSSYKNHILKVKLWWAGARKKRPFFVLLILHEGNFFKICFVSMYIVLNTLSEYAYLFGIKKHYFIHFCCLFLKLLKDLYVSRINRNLLTVGSFQTDFLYVLIFV